GCWRRVVRIDVRGAGRCIPAGAARTHERCVRRGIWTFVRDRTDAWWVSDRWARMAVGLLRQRAARNRGRAPRRVAATGGALERSAPRHRLVGYRPAVRGADSVVDRAVDDARPRL